MIDYILWYPDVVTIADDSNYRSEVEPLFRSTSSSFFVTLYNLNYNVPVDSINMLREEVLYDAKWASDKQKQALDEPKKGLHDKKKALDEQKTGLHEMLFPNDFIDNLNVSTPTKDNKKSLFTFWI